MADIKSKCKTKVYEYGIMSPMTTGRMKDGGDPESTKGVCLSCCATIAKHTHRQSPINIEEKTAKFQDFLPFTFTGYENLSIAKGTLKAKNTGGTLKLLADLGVGLLAGGPLNVQYEFVELHFHWGDVNAPEDHAGSEHKVNGKSYPLELHMVHKNIHDNSIEDALAHDNGLCVLAFVFEVVDYETPIPGLDALATIAVDHLTEANSIFDLEKQKSMSEAYKDVRVANFVPLHLEEYFTYRGSLTTGGCEEAVNWVFFRTPLAINKRHLQSFQSLKNEEQEPIKNNYRQTMSANTRPLYYNGEELLANNVISMGKPVGLRSLDAAPVAVKKMDQMVSNTEECCSSSDEDCCH